MRDFEYDAPDSLAGAIAQLSEHAGSARPLAGGTDLIDHLRTGRVDADLVVDIKKIPELNALTTDKNGLRLGAAVPCATILGTEAVSREYRALHDACRIIGGIQIQSRASVGGNLCNAGAAADSTPALIALDATCEIAGPNGTRTVAVENFCTGPGENSLQPGELLVALTCPHPVANTGSHYRRFIPRNEMDIAVVGVGARVTLAEDRTIADARVALGAVAAVPFLASEVNSFLIGKKPTEEVLKEAGEIAKGLVSPIDDHRGTVEFRTHVTGVLVERVMAEAVSNASATT